MSASHDDDTEAATGGAPMRGEPPVIAAGTQVGRYVVLERVGSGGMGVVYSAWDPELDRRIALKLLRPDVGSGSSRASSAGNRLLREARAMAALQHPNVVAVHDVGEHTGFVFVAMEFVQGTTLRGWLSTPRTQAEILSVFTQAGRGLVAAHEQGLVHRDFKPDNAMLGEDGRVRTLDFGLVRHAGPSEGTAPEQTTSEGVPRLGATPDGTDALATIGPVGTPRYMSPEQHLGETADDRSDQFSFCVALYEALYCARPFEGDTTAALAAATLDGAVTAAPDKSEVPGWLRAVLLRGLAVRPDDRHPSMASLLDALAHDPSSKRRAYARTGAATVLIGAVVATAIVLGTEEKPCSGFEDALVGVWDGARKAQVSTAMLATEQAYSEDAWLAVESGFDAWSNAWLEGRRDACEAANVRRDQSPALMDRRVVCYDDSLRQVEALVAVLVHADVEAVIHAARAVDRVDGLDRCADAEALLADVAPPKDEGTKLQVAELRDEHAGIAASLSAGKPAPDLIDSAKSLVERAGDVAYPPLSVTTLHQLAHVQYKAGQPRDALETQQRAHKKALELGSPVLASITARSLQTLHGTGLGEFEAADVYALHAEALCAASSQRDCQGGNHTASGMVAFARGEYELSRQHDEAALALADELYGKQHQKFSTAQRNLANDLRALGRYDESRKLQLNAFALAERRLGTSHPYLVTQLANLGAVTHDLGETEEAVRLYQRAIEVGERAFGPEHPEVAMVLNNMGNALTTLGRLDEAQTALERALSIRRTKLRPNHPWTAATLHNLGELAQQREQPEVALKYQEEALTIAEAALGPEHANVGLVHCALALTLSELGRPGDALQHLERGIPLLERGKGASNPELLTPLAIRSEILAKLARVPEAIAEAERAQVIAGGGEASPESQADAASRLAELLWTAPVGGGRDRDRARKVVQSEVAEHADNKRVHVQAAVNELREWLLAHPVAE